MYKKYKMGNLKIVVQTTNIWTIIQVGLFDEFAKSDNLLENNLILFTLNLS